MSHLCRSILLLGLLSSVTAAAAEPLHRDAPTLPGTPMTRDAFYCQAPDYAMIYQMSSGFDAEFADDIPAEWIGHEIAAVTLWLGEWYSVGGPGWTTPVGIRLNFYHESCPPELAGFRSIEVAWADLEKTHVYDSIGSDVYEIVVPVNPPVTVGDAMSIGATALIDWGHDEPFTGLCATPFYVAYGACSAYLDGSWWGYVRWTALDHFTGIPQDLGYCLTGPATAVSPVPATEIMLHQNSPNPFNPTTEIRFDLPDTGEDVTLTIFDSSGLRVRELLSGPLPAGHHRATWHGRDDRGVPVSSGIYFYRLNTPSFQQTRKMLLLQ